eukprot:GDKI01048475.1.p2 GENE.GDKI01048475.1~~GDKI01048475.1.p2  ORF type:complete len:126 (+),score=17.83 GDKI01048475.1:190-567(+)
MLGACSLLMQTWPTQQAPAALLVPIGCVCAGRLCVAVHGSCRNAYHGPLESAFPSETAPTAAPSFTALGGCTQSASDSWQGIQLAETDRYKWAVLGGLVWVGNVTACLRCNKRDSLKAIWAIWGC